MKATRLAIPEVVLIEPKVFGDARGFFFESFNQKALNIRKSSPTFGQWVAEELSEDNHRQLWVPPGFAHGFVVMSEMAEFLYKTTDYYASASERCIAWNDLRLGIRWPYKREPRLSANDAQMLALAAAEVFV